MKPIHQQQQAIIILLTRAIYHTIMAVLSKSIQTNPLHLYQTGYSAGRPVHESARVCGNGTLRILRSKPFISKIIKSLIMMKNNDDEFILISVIKMLLKCAV